jgi:hypothetical protein
LPGSNPIGGFPRIVKDLIYPLPMFLALRFLGNKVQLQDDRPGMKCHFMVNLIVKAGIMSL